MQKFTVDLENCIKILRKNLLDLQKLGVKQIGIFGSASKGEVNDISDLDILVDFEDSKNTYKNLLAVHDFLQDLFPLKIDLVTKKALSKYIKDSVLNEVIYIETSI